MGICKIVNWFGIQMPGTMVVWYSDHHLVNGQFSDHPLVNRPVLRPPFEFWSAIQMPGTMSFPK